MAQWLSGSVAKKYTSLAPLPPCHFATDRMPTYEYECKRCHKTHEMFHSITAKPLTKCPRCGGRLKRLLGTGSGFLFKGSGFYITDYRSKSYREAKKRDEQRSSPPVSPGPATGSTKPAGTPPSSTDK